MITSLSQRITEFLIREKSISEKDAEIYQYGVEITISSLLNIILVLLASAAAKNIISGIVFLSVFITLRQFSGGYHATTYFRCNAVLLITYVAVLLLSRYVVISFWVNCTLVLLGVMALILFAPVPNIHKPLTKDECRKHKRNALIIYIVISVIALLILDAAPYYSRLLMFTLMSIVMLIIVEILMQRSGLHED